MTNITGSGGNDTPVQLRLSGLGSITSSTLHLTFTYHHTDPNDAVYASWFEGSVTNASVSYTPQGNSVHFSGDPVLDNFTDTITLSNSNDWVIQKTIGGREGASSNFDYPAMDSDGHAYHYLVEETPIEGYDTTYSPNNTNGVQSGVLTVYNRSNIFNVLPTE